MRRVFFLLLISGLARPALGQGRREIQLPDTLGARFAIADSARKLGSASDYDFLAGMWVFRFQGRNQDGTYFPAFTGHWWFEKKPGGMLIEDRWRPDDPSEPMGSSTYTYRAFDPERKVWQMMGTRDTGGEWNLGLTWGDGSNRYAIQRYGPGLVRIRYFAIEKDHFLWRADRSMDGAAEKPTPSLPCSTSC